MCNLCMRTFVLPMSLTRTGLAVAETSVAGVVASITLHNLISRIHSVGAPSVIEQLKSVNGRRNRSDVAHALPVLKPNIPYDQFWQEIRIDRFSDQLSDEGPLKEIEVSVKYFKVC